MNREYLDELLELLKSEISDAEKKELILQYHENDIAEMLEELDKEDRIKLYTLLGDDNVADVLPYVEDVEELVEDLSTDHVADIIELMDADDAIDILEELDEEQREEIVSLMDEESVSEINDIVKYDDDMIGSRMTNNYISITNTDTVKSAMKKVIKEASDNDNLSHIYVVDDNDKFYGVIELRDLIIARQTDELEKIIKLNYPVFYATSLVEDCLNSLMDYALDSYPILDSDDHLIGVITSDDVIEVVEEEMSDDYAKLAGLTEEENLEESILASVKKRLPWLIVLLILGLAQAFCMTGFDRIVAALPVIIFFQTSVLAMAGNTGTQALAVTIRSLSDLDEKNKIIGKTVFKELRIAFLNGFVLSLLATIFVFIFLIITKKSVIDGGVFNYEYSIRAALIVGTALLSAMTVSGFVGTIIPIVFMKIKIDPAVASGPFITTINDVTALLIYYGLAYVMFQSLI